MVHNIICINTIKYAGEGFLFRYTNNHTADSSEGCLKTVDVFTCSNIFVSLYSFLAQPLLTAIPFLQSRNLVQLVTLHMLFFFNFPSFMVLYFLVTLMLDVGSFILLLVLAVRQERKVERIHGNDAS